jgi:glycosyltransferase involved in cell wall biosynthesis
MEQPKRIAIVHEWLTGMRGGEKFLEAVCELFPAADLYTLLHVRGSVSALIEQMPITTSFIQYLPFSKTRYRHFPFVPVLPSADSISRSTILFISSHHCVAKGVRTGPETLHVCYCHTPMRYIWEMYDEYFGKQAAGIITRIGARLFLNKLRRWDLETANNPQYYVTNSNHVRNRIQRIYHRDAEVLFGPADVRSFRLSNSDEGYFLVAGALVPYKRADLAIEAFNITGNRLVIVGQGPDEKRLKQMSKSNIQFAGWQTDEGLRTLYAGCRALVFPGEEGPRSRSD